MRGSRLFLYETGRVLLAGLDGYYNPAGSVAKHLDNRLRADNGAGGTTCTIAAVSLCGEVAVLVGYR